MQQRIGTAREIYLLPHVTPCGRVGAVRRPCLGHGARLVTWVGDSWMPNQTHAPACLPRAHHHLACFSKGGVTGGLTERAAATASEPDEVVRVTAGSSRRQIARTLSTNHRAGSDRDVAISTVCLYSPFYPQRNEAARWVLYVHFSRLLD